MQAFYTEAIRISKQNVEIARHLRSPGALLDCRASLHSGDDLGRLQLKLGHQITVLDVTERPAAWV